MRSKINVEINDTIMKYKTKKKHHIYVETLAGKTMGIRENFIMNRRKIQSTTELRIKNNTMEYKVQGSATTTYPFFFSTFSFHKICTAGLQVGHKPKTKIRVTNQQLKMALSMM